MSARATRELLGWWHRARRALAGLGRRVGCSDHDAPMSSSNLRSTGTHGRQSTSRPSTSGRDPAAEAKVYELVRVLTVMTRARHLPCAFVRLRERPQRPGHPRAEPRILHGPLLHRRLHPPPRPVHGQITALHWSWRLDFHPWRRLPGPPGTPRRGGLCHRLRASWIAGSAIVMYCEGGRSRTGAVGEEARPGIGRLALESGAPVVPIAMLGSHQVRNWRRLQFPRIRIQFGVPFRFARIPGSTREQQQQAAD